MKTTRINQNWVLKETAIPQNGGAASYIDRVAVNPVFPGLELHSRWAGASCFIGNPWEMLKEAGKIRTETHSVAGCVSGNYSWGDSWYGSRDGKNWTLISREGETSHTNNGRQTGWERLGTTKSPGWVGLINPNHYKWVIQLYTGPERHSGNQYLGRYRQIDVFEIPSSARPTSLARLEKRAKLQRS